MKSKTEKKSSVLKSIITVRLKESELAFCEYQAKNFRSISVQEFIRELIQSAMSPEVKPKFEEHFADLDQKLDRLIRKSNQFESAFKELLEANGALKGFIIADVNMRDKATLKTMRERIDKSIQEHKELAYEIFKSAKYEKVNDQ